MRRLWTWFTRPSHRLGWGLLVMAGMILAGCVGWAFTTVVGHTNTTAFCVSCHSMGTNYEEYKKSTHFMNRTGVRAECADCHVPRDFWPKMGAKIVAAKDVWHELIGTIDTPEKFAAHRLEMAQRVWAKMEATGSRECRECHAFEAMDLEQQGRRPRQKHPKAMEEGQTCITCHKGVVHELPEGFNRDG